MRTRLTSEQQDKLIKEVLDLFDYLQTCDVFMDAYREKMCERLLACQSSSMYSASGVQHIFAGRGGRGQQCVGADFAGNSWQNRSGPSDLGAGRGAGGMGRRGSKRSKQAKHKEPSTGPSMADMPMQVQCDRAAAMTWEFPQHYTVRKYQQTIVQHALFKNCLVMLPTGLGKTLIAAVVMKNFYRWFPGGKVIFMAPTTPLVEQQVEACYKVMGIPPDDTAQLCANVKKTERKKFWANRSVFFCTPQTLARRRASLRGAAPCAAQRGTCRPCVRLLTRGGHAPGQRPQVRGHERAPQDRLRCGRRRWARCVRLQPTCAPRV